MILKKILIVSLFLNILCFQKSLYSLGIVSSLNQNKTIFIKEFEKRGAIYFEEKKYKEIISLLNQEKPLLEKTYELYKDKQEEAYLKGDLAEHIINLSFLYSNYAKAYKEMKNNEKTIEFYAKAIDLYKQGIEIYYKKIESCGEEKNNFYSEKVKELKEYCLNVYHKRYSLYLSLDMFDKAEADCKAMIKLDKERASLYEIKGFAIFKQVRKLENQKVEIYKLERNYKEAKKSYEKAMQGGSKNFELYYYYAKILVRLGIIQYKKKQDCSFLLKEAESYFLKALQLDREYFQIYYEIGKVYIILSDCCYNKGEVSNTIYYQVLIVENYERFLLKAGATFLSTRKIIYEYLNKLYQTLEDYFYIDFEKFTVLRKQRAEYFFSKKESIPKYNFNINNNEQEKLLRLKIEKARSEKRRKSYKNKVEFYDVQTKKEGTKIIKKSLENILNNNAKIISKQTNIATIKKEISKKNDLNKLYELEKIKIETKKQEKSNAKKELMKKNRLYKLKKNNCKKKMDNNRVELDKISIEIEKVGKNNFDMNNINTLDEKNKKLEKIIKRQNQKYDKEINLFNIKNSLIKEENKIFEKNIEIINKKIKNQKELELIYQEQINDFDNMISEFELQIKELNKDKKIQNKKIKKYEKEIKKIERKNGIQYFDIGKKYHIVLNKYDEAEKKYEQALEYIENIDIYFNLAELKYKNKEYKNALDACENALNFKNNADKKIVTKLYKLKADIHKVLNQFEYAAIEYKNAILVNSKDYYLYLCKGKMLLELNLCEDALKDLKESESLFNKKYSKGNSHRHLELIDIYIIFGDIFVVMKKYEKALIYYKKVLMIDKVCMPVFEKIRKILELQKNKDEKDKYDKIINFLYINKTEGKYHFDKVILNKQKDEFYKKVQKKNFKPYEKIGDLFCIKKKYKDAIKEYWNAQKQEPLEKKKQELFYKIGFNYRCLADIELCHKKKKYYFETALDNFNKAGSEILNIYYQFGYVYMRLFSLLIDNKKRTEYFEKSKQNYEKYLKEKSNNVSAYYDLAGLYFLNKEYQKAVENYTKVIKREKKEMEQLLVKVPNCDAKSELLPYAYLQRAKVYQNLDKEKLALKDFSQCIRLVEEDGLDIIEAYIGRGKIYLNKNNNSYNKKANKDFEKAEAYYKKLINVNKMTDENSVELWAIYKLMEKTQTKIKKYKQLVKQCSNEKVPYYMLKEKYSKENMIGNFIKLCSCAIKIGLNKSEWYYERGIVYWSLGYRKQADNDFENAEKFNKEYSLKIKNMKKIYKKLNKIEIEFNNSKNKVSYKTNMKKLEKINNLNIRKELVMLILFQNNKLKEIICKQTEKLKFSNMILLKNKSDKLFLSVREEGKQIVKQLLCLKEIDKNGNFKYIITNGLYKKINALAGTGIDELFFNMLAGLKIEKFFSVNNEASLFFDIINIINTLEYFEKIKEADEYEDKILTDKDLLEGWFDYIKKQGKTGVFDLKNTIILKKKKKDFLAFIEKFV